MKSLWSIGLTKASSLETLQHGLHIDPIIQNSNLEEWGGVAAADPFAIQVDGVWFVFF